MLRDILDLLFVDKPAISRSQADTVSSYVVYERIYHFGQTVVVW